MPPFPNSYLSRPVDVTGHYPTLCIAGYLTIRASSAIEAKSPEREEEQKNGGKHVEDERVTRVSEELDIIQTVFY